MGILESIKTNFLPKWRKNNDRGSFITQKQWVDTSKLTLDVYDELYTRMGLAHKLVNKLADDRFDKWFEVDTDSEDFKDKLDLLNSAKINGGLGVKSIFTEGRKFALRHGYSVIFIQYVDKGESLKDPVLNPQAILGLKVISSKDIREIVLEDNPDNENFGEIKGYKLDSRLFNGTQDELFIHASRTIHVIQKNGNDPRGLSFYTPTYNWLNMFDDIAWSIGQSYFRNAGGFPVLTVKGWEGLDDDTREDYQKQWKNVHSMIGYVKGDGDTIEFKGAEGKALSPTEYFDAAAKLIGASTDLPYALIVGVNAGAITGSEVNLQEYYGNVSNKQTLEEQPLLENLYSKLQETGQLPEADYEIHWNQLFTITEEEQANIDKTKAETYKILREAGVQTKEMQEKIKSGEIVETEKLAPTIPTVDQIIKHAINSADVKTIEINRKQNPIISKFSTPKYLKLERDYFNELLVVFKDMSNKIIKIVKREALDSAKTDDIPNNIKSLTADIGKIFKEGKKKFPNIIDLNIGNAVNEGIKSATEELGVKITVPKTLANQKKNIVASEHTLVVDNIADDIAKDVGVNMGVFALNPPAGIGVVEKAIRDAFNSKRSRLKMGVGNETNSALNQGNLLGYDESGIIVGKEWVAIVDGSTTDTCLSLNGEVVAIGESFSSGDFAPPAADPPHPCRSSLRGVTKSEMNTL